MVKDYYSTCAYPKPSGGRKQKLYNGYKDKPGRVCRYCGQRGADRHEVFGGSNRQTSIRYGFQVDVCGQHHQELHENATPWAQAENRRLRRHYEVKYIKDQMAEGMTARQALTSWMQLIGKNYVEEFMPE